MKGESVMSQEENEISAVFYSRHSLQQSIDDLLQAGFDRADISLIAEQEEVEEALGDDSDKQYLIQTSDSTPRVHYISPEAIGNAEGIVIGLPIYVAALCSGALSLAYDVSLIAAIVNTLAAALVGALIGYGCYQYIIHRQARYFKNHLKARNLILWVKIRTTDGLRLAQQILSQNHAQNMYLKTN